MTDLKDDFKTEWRRKFVSAPLPDLRCFTSVQGGKEMFENLDLDEKELKEKLEQINFSFNWITKRKEKITQDLEEDSKEYANLASKPTRPTRHIPRMGSIGRRPTEPKLVGSNAAPTPAVRHMPMPLSVIPHAKENNVQVKNMVSPNSPTSTMHDNETRMQYVMMKKNLTKKLSLVECKNLSYHFGAVTFDLRAKITSTSIFLDLLQSNGSISELDVDDLAGALEAEKLHGALDIVTFYKESTRSTSEPEEEESEESYLKMLPIRVDKINPADSAVVSDEDLRILSVKIANSFKTFGRDVLKFTAKEITKWLRSSDEEHRQAMHMLLKWKQRLGHLATTAQLTALLKEFNYGPDVWGFLEGMPNDGLSPNEITEDIETFQSIVIKGYIKSSPEELSIKKGDQIIIQDRGRAGWYYGDVMNHRGWVPNYCVREEDGVEKQFRFLFVVETTTDSGRWEEGFLTYRNKELLDVIEETFVKSKTIYRARNSDGFIGFIIPTNCVRTFRKETILSGKEWFHPRVMRHQAIMLLRQYPQGAYLIREASKPGDFVLNVKTAEENTNFLIKTTNVGYKISDKKFKSIREIIDYYKRFPIKDNVCLTSAVGK